MNVDNDQHQEEVIRVANAIRLEQGSVDKTMRSRIFSIYYFRLLRPSAATPAFIYAVAPADHIATFRWLFDGLEVDESNSLLRAFYLCALQEAAGQREDALAGYQRAATDPWPMGLMPESSGFHGLHRLLAGRCLHSLLGVLQSRPELLSRGVPEP
jgi:hypothetical protein